VRDKFGQKMSKSKGNVINPMEMIDKYGADALRLALVFEVKEGADQSLSEEKIIGMRNFVNKVWNIGRFIYLNLKEPRTNIKNKNQPQTNKILKNLKNEFKKEKRQYQRLMKNYKFSLALSLIHKFLWHRLADIYLEQLKDEIKNGNIKVLEELKKFYLDNLKMLHPFAPFVTEVIWKKFFGEKETILKVNKR
jgi:valyl-tRNA synthetase